MNDDTSTKILRERILFVYAMNGKVKCYSLDETEPTTKLIEEGWKHTATIDPARWIESLASGDCAADMINEIRGAAPLPSPEATTTNYLADAPGLRDAYAQSEVLRTAFRHSAAKGETLEQSLISAVRRLCDASEHWRKELMHHLSSGTIPPVVTPAMRKCGLSEATATPTP